MKAGRLERALVLRDAQRDRESFAFAIFAHHPHAARPLLRGGSRPDVRFNADLSRFYRIKSEDRSEEFRASRTDDPGDAEHFAAMQGK